MNTKKVVIVDKDIESIVPTFLQNRENDITLLRGHIKDNDFESIETIGHKMAGNAGGYGFDDLGTIGRNIENAAQESNMESIEKSVVEIEEYLSSIEVKYE